MWVIDPVEGSHAYHAANGYANAATLQVHIQEDTLHNVLSSKLCYSDRLSHKVVIIGRWSLYRGRNYYKQYWDTTKWSL